MKVEFLTGYQGWITNDVRHEKGDVEEVEPRIAAYLVHHERAVIVEPAPIEATPQATELAIKQGIDLAQVSGSGADGRILVGDVKAYLDD